MIDVWKRDYGLHKIDFRVSHKDKQNVRELLVKEKISDSDIEVMISNVQDAIDLQMQKNSNSNPHQHVLNSNDFFDEYHTLEEYQGFIDDLARRFPNIVESFSIG